MKKQDLQEIQEVVKNAIYEMWNFVIEPRFKALEVKIDSLPTKEWVSSQISLLPTKEYMDDKHADLRAEFNKMLIRK